MIWTILVLIVGIVLYVFGGMLLAIDTGKKPTAGLIVCNKLIKIFAIILVSGCVARMVVPYYLTNVNPLILQTMAQNAQEQQQAEKNKVVRSYIRANGQKLIDHAPVLGKTDAKKTIFVWTDFSCPYCRRVHGELDRVLKARDDVRIVIKNFSIHGALSDAPAKAVIAAKLQDSDKAAKLVDTLMTHEFYTQEDRKDASTLGKKVEENVMKFAAEVGLDTEQLKKDMDSEVVSNEISEVRELAQEFEINGTPYLIVNEHAFPGAIPYDQIMKALDE